MNTNALFDGSVIGSDDCTKFCNENRIFVLASLPVVMSELAGLCGFDVMFKLVNHSGGKKIYLPKSLDGFERNYGICIPENSYHYWRRLSKLNGQIEVPSKWGIFLSLRRTAIYIALREGISNDELILSFGITQRQLRNLKVKFN